MADQLLQEVDADLRADQLHQLWQQYKRTLLFVVIALLVMTAADSLWQNYREKVGGRHMLALSDAQTLFDQGKYTEAAAAFEKAASEVSGETRTLARLWQGRALVRAGKKPEAIAVLKPASEDRSLWGDLACLRLAGLDQSAATCLSDTHDSPLAGKRREWHAAGAWQNGDTNEAITTFEELATSSDTTEATRAEITGWLATLRATAKPSEKAAEEKVPAKESTKEETNEE